MCLAVPGKITDLYTVGTLRMAKVDFGGVMREVCVEALPEAKIGDYTIVHAGFALNLLSEAEAQETLDMLRQITNLYDELVPSEPDQG
jgi:hydrogenase expression/formation protein HypC